jgi:hypothetical protein
MREGGTREGGNRDNGFLDGATKLTEGTDLFFNRLRIRRGAGRTAGWRESAPASNWRVVWNPDPFRPLAPLLRF